MSRTFRFASSTRKAKAGSSATVGYTKSITSTVVIGGTGPSIVAGAAQLAASGALTCSPTVAPASGGFPSTVNSALPIPTLTLNTINSDGSSPTFLIGNVADAQVNDTLWIEQRNKTGAVVARFSKAVTLADAEAETASFGLSAITAGTYRYTVTLQRGTERSDYSEIVIGGPDDAEPVLTVSAPTSVTHTAATLQFAVDEPATVYWVVTTSTTKPSTAQIDTGKDHTGATAAATGSEVAAAAGAVTDSLGGLAATTGYYVHAYAKDTANNPTTVGTSPLFTTLATPSAAWDPANKNAEITLSNSNLTATGTNLGGFQSVVTNTAMASGTAVLTIDTVVGGGSENGFGLAYDAFDRISQSKTSPHTIGIICGTWGYEIKVAGVTADFDYGAACGAGTVLSFVRTGSSVQFKRNGVNIGSAQTIPAGTGSLKPFFYTTDASAGTADFTGMA